MIAFAFFGLLSTVKMFVEEATWSGNAMISTVTISIIKDIFLDFAMALEYYLI